MLQSAGGLRWHSGQTAAQEADDDCSSAVQAFGNLRMNLSRDGRQRWRPVRQRRLPGCMQHLWVSSDLCICVHDTFVSVCICVWVREHVHTDTHTHNEEAEGRKGIWELVRRERRERKEGGRNMYTFHNFLSYLAFSLSHQHMPSWLSSSLFWQCYLAGLLLLLSTYLVPAKSPFCLWVLCPSECPASSHSKITLLRELLELTLRCIPPMNLASHCPSTHQSNFHIYI